MVWKIKSRYLASNPSTIHPSVQALDSSIYGPTLWYSSCAEIFIFELKLMENAVFTRQLNCVRDTSLLLQVTRVIGVAVLNHLWNFSPNLWKVMKEGKNKKTNHTKKKKNQPKKLKKLEGKTDSIPKRTHICKLIISAQHWFWPTYISHRHVYPFKPGIKSTAVKQSSTPQCQKSHNPDNSVGMRNIFLMMLKCSYS